MLYYYHTKWGGPNPEKDTSFYQGEDISHVITLVAYLVNLEILSCENLIKTDNIIQYNDSRTHVWKKRDIFVNIRIIVT